MPRSVRPGSVGPLISVIGGPYFVAIAVIVPAVIGIVVILIIVVLEAVGTHIVIIWRADQG